MTSWWWLLLAAVPALFPALRVFDRICLRLEERGYLFYRHKQPTSSASSVTILLQQIIEPSAKEIVETYDEPLAGTNDQLKTRSQKRFFPTHPDIAGDPPDFHPPTSIYRSR
jgi:hypothetical protein